MGYKVWGLPGPGCGQSKRGPLERVLSRDPLQGLGPAQIHATRLPSAPEGRRPSGGEGLQDGCP